MRAGLAGLRPRPRGAVGEGGGRWEQAGTLHLWGAPAADGPGSQTTAGSGPSPPTSSCPSGTAGLTQDAPVNGKTCRRAGPSVGRWSLCPLASYRRSKHSAGPRLGVAGEGCTRPGGRETSSVSPLLHSPPTPTPTPQQGVTPTLGDSPPPGKGESERGSHHLVGHSDPAPAKPTTSEGWAGTEKMDSPGLLRDISSHGRRSRGPPSSSFTSSSVGSTYD